MPSILFVLWALSFGVARSPAQESASPEASVPAGREPTLDGVVDAEEWADAVVLASHGTGTGDEVVLLGKHAAGKLFLGVRAKRPGIASLGVADDQVIRVLHSSASLGDVEYRLAEGAWKRATAFEWRCKNPADTDETKAERREHLEKRGWLATTMKMGRGQTEFAIAAPLVKSSKDGVATVELALSLFGGTAFSAPAGLSDGLRDQMLQMGNAPEELRFTPDQWMRLRLAPEAKPADPAAKE